MDPLPRLNILVVEDDTLQREALAAFLLALRQRPILAEDGDEAIALFEKKQPDLILMDVLLPTINGFETTRRIRRLCGERWIPIVYLTVLGGTEKLIEGLEAGGDDYLVKPINVDTLQAKLRSVIRTLGLYRQLEASNEELAKTNRTLTLANQELDTFAYSVAHDLKAPLRAIMGYSSLLEEDHAAQLAPEGREYIGKISGSAALMSKLIDDMLVYARLERGSVQIEVIDLGEVINNALHNFSHAIDTHGARIQYDTACCEVRADRAALELALGNLLGNALKFAAQAESPLVEIGIERHRESVRLWVRDNGIGFDMKHHDRIFDLFQRLHRTDQYPGTGVGLAIVRKAAQRMSGRTWAESTPGKGATFFLEWPL